MPPTCVLSCRLASAAPIYEVSDCGTHEPDEEAQGDAPFKLALAAGIAEQQRGAEKSVYRDEEDAEDDERETPASTKARAATWRVHF
jgi:hypothetical protein